MFCSALNGIGVNPKQPDSSISAVSWLYRARVAGRSTCGDGNTSLATGLGIFHS
jgi:hypothetical protein